MTSIKTWRSKMAIAALVLAVLAPGAALQAQETLPQKDLDVVWATP